MRGDDFVRINLGDEPLDERGLSRSDVAGNNDEAFATLQALGQVRHSLGVNAALEVEALIRCQKERFGPKLVVVRVHTRRSF